MHVIRISLRLRVKGLQLCVGHAEDGGFDGTGARASGGSGGFEDEVSFQDRLGLHRGDPGEDGEDLGVLGRADLSE